MGRSLPWGLLFILFVTTTAYSAEGIADRVEFDRLSKSIPRFRVSSPEELVRIKHYRDDMLNEGDIVHRFVTREGQDCLCLDVRTQPGAVAAGLKPEEVFLEPLVPPQGPPATTTSEHAP